MIIIASIISLFLLAIILTIILDLINNRDNPESYRLALTALNCAIGFVTSLALHLFLGFKSVGSALIKLLGFTI